MTSALRGLTSETLAEQAYAALRAAIVSGELASGEKITERGLAERLAVSPTPVREALRRLEQDGLVARRGPRLVQVVDFDGETAAEVRLAEGALRAVAARLAATHATHAQLTELERILDAGDAELDRLRAGDDRAELSTTDVAPILEITRRFHERLSAACGNPVILRLLSLVDAFRLASLNRRLVAELSADGNRAALERYQEHRHILEAVAAGDGLAAERLMRAHDQRDALDPLHAV
jgi:DNA-binding GntR family transcriptional regulator